MRVLSPSLNKKLYTVEERLQMARFQQACELEEKKSRLSSSEQNKQMHLRRLSDVKYQERLVSQELSNLKQMQKNLNEHR
jgi:hypothetical protein